ncbi:MAG: glycosyltransferase family 39 protein [candidate division Zixibacteria bacterium]|nr:glycosyltransferase family 39 protein [candidate division Zixibacteria bacterium]MDH3936206.1 glycosyltransferase family 39 protein [candidate division Zixibacteria bacterium]
MKNRRDRKGPKPSTRSQPFWIEHKSLLIIIAVGALLRGLYDIDLAGSIFWGNYLLDSQAYHTWALDILNGVKMDSPFFRAPLYPYTVAQLYQWFGVSPWPVVVFQNILGLLTVVVTYRFATKLIGRRLALWAAAVVAVYPTLIFYEGETLMTTMTVFLYMLAIYCSYIAVNSPRLRNSLVAGVVLGLAAITRPTILPLLIILPVALLLKSGWSNRKMLMLPSLWFLLGISLPILPVTLANVTKGGEFVLISTQGGVNFYIGNNSEADGITVKSPGPPLRMGKYRDNVWTASVDEAERRAGRKFRESEVSSFWFGETVKEMTEEPMAAAVRVVRKFYYFFHGQEIINNYSLYYSGEYSWFMRLALWKYALNFPTGLIFGLAFLGFFYARRERLDLFVPLAYVVGMALVVTAFFVCARFRQPVLPLAVVFAVYGGRGLIGYFHSDRRFFWVGLTVLALLLAVLNIGGDIDSPTNRSFFAGFVGNSYHNRADYDQAAMYMERALRLSPDNMQLYENLGKTYMKSNQIDKAKSILEAGLQKFPVYPQYNFSLGRIAQLNNDIEAARQYFRTTIQYAPDFAPGYDRLGYIFDQEGQLDSALYQYEQLYRLRPNDTRLLAKINQLKQALGLNN